MQKFYKLKSFLRQLDESLSKEYFSHKNIPLPSQPKKEKESETDYWLRFIHGLEQKIIDSVERDFREINDMADEASTLSFIESAEKSPVSLQKEFENIEGFHNKSLYCFIKHQNIFDLASTLHHINELKAKAERTGLKKKTIEQVTDKNKVLEQALSDYLQSKDGRGRHCQVDVFPDKDRICFLAYPEDYIKTDLHYEQGKLKKTSRRPSFEIVFIYYPTEGRLELNTKGGKKKEIALFNIFNEVVLEDAKPVLEIQRVYDLNKFLDRDFTLTTRLEDQIENVSLKQLRLSYKYSKTKKRIILETNEPNGIKPMQEMLSQLNINKNEINVTQATVKIKFPGKGRKGNVTMQITWPDKCNLNDTPLHQKAKKYLKIWGLENYPGN